MSSLDYPATLPRPEVAKHQARGRTAGSDFGGGRPSYRARERDYSGTFTAEFLFTKEQAAVFYAWWRDDLIQGGMCFNAVWPSFSPDLFVYHFLGAPVFNHLAEGACRVSMTFELRGTSLPVALCERDEYYSCDPGAAVDRSPVARFALIGNLLDEVSPSPVLSVADASAITHGPMGAQFVIDGTDNSVNCLSTKFDANGVESLEASVDATFDFTGVSGTGDAVYFFVLGAGSNQAGFQHRVESGVLKVYLSATFGGASAGTLHGPMLTGPVRYKVAFDPGAVRWYINDTLVRTAVTGATASSGHLRLGPVTAGGGGSHPPSVTLKDALVEIVRPKSRTVLLLHAESLLDSSCYAPKTVTLGGAAAISTANKKFQESSFLLTNPGSSSATQVFVADHADFDFQSGDFTVDLWAFRTSNTHVGTLFQFDSASPTNLQVNASGVLTVSYSTNQGSALTVNTGVTFPLGQWNYVVFQRRKGSFEVWLNRVPVFAVRVPGSFADLVNMASGFRIGSTAILSTQVWTGYADEVRITRGVARHDSSIPEPTGAPADGDVLDSLLCHFDGPGFVDSSIRTKTLTVSGGAVISSAVAKFGPGAGLFDGAGDYLRVTNHADFAFGSADFTIDGYFLISALPGARKNWGLLGHGLVSSDRSWVLYVGPPSTGNRFTFVAWVSSGSVFVESSSPPLLGSWNHFAVTREGSFLSLYLNKVLVSRRIITLPVLASTQPIDIGTLYSGSGITNSYLDGRLDEIRITKGLARYSPNIDLPRRETCSDT